MKKGLMLMLLSALVITSACSKHERRHRRHSVVKHLKDGVKMAKKAKKVPKGVKEMARRLFVQASVGRLDMAFVQKMMPDSQLVAGVTDKPDKFLKKLTDPAKLKAKMETWQRFCKGATFDSVRKADEFRLSKDSAPEKYAKLAALLTNPIKVVEAKVWARKNGRKFKCTFAAAKIVGKWTLLKLKSCEWK